MTTIASASVTPVVNAGATEAPRPRYRTLEEAQQALNNANANMLKVREALWGPGGHGGKSRAVFEALPAIAAARAEVVRLGGPPPAESRAASKPPASEDRSIDEATRGGLAFAETARDDIEFLSSMIGQYNSSKYTVSDPKALDYIRQNYGEDSANKFLEMARKTLESARQHLVNAQDRMAQLYKVTGPLVTTDDRGFLAHGAFTLAKSQSGWSIKVASDGAAVVTANGVDVSALVDNRKNNGEFWSTPGRAVDVKV